MSGKLAIAILAAGTGSRFGGHKLDAELAGRMIGTYAVEAAATLGVPKIVSSLPLPEFAAEAMACGEAQILKNKDAGEGLSASVALAAIQASAAGAHALLLVAADMPMVTAATLQKLADAVAPGVPACASYGEGRPGIPACFPADWFAKLASLTGDQGAGMLLRDADSVTLIEVQHEELADVDTAKDLAALRAQHRL